MTRDVNGGPLEPGVNVDRVDIGAGIEFARDLGYVTNGNDYVLVEYALQRHARGEEGGAEATWMGHFGPQSLTSWRMVVARAVTTANAAARPRPLDGRDRPRDPHRWDRVPRDVGGPRDRDKHA